MCKPKQKMFNKKIETRQQIQRISLEEIKKNPLPPYLPKHLKQPY